MKDLKFNENGFVFENGDFVLHESEDQHAVDMLRLNFGELRHNPIAGCNLSDFLGFDTNFEDIKQKLTEQLRLDGFKLSLFELDQNNKILIECEAI
jgi:hypothetical protein